MGEVGREYDLAILGGGPAGYIAAIRAGQLGLDTVLVEKALLGGVCLNSGCIPSKMLLNVSHLVSEQKYLSSVGVDTQIKKVDMKKLRAENLNVVERLRAGVTGLLQKNKVTVVEGIGRFESSGHLHVKTGSGVETLRFRKAIVATGSRSYVPENIKIGGNVITSREALFLTELPKSIVIIGAGYIAAEMGTFFTQMGSDVHILARSRLLSRMDEDLVREAQKGVGTVHENCTIVSVKDAKKAKVVFSENGKEKEISADKVIVAIGRVPNVQNIGLENTRVTIDKQGFIDTNIKCETSDTQILAAGDVAGGPLLAHKAFMQGKVAAESAAGLKSAGFEPLAIPEVVFTSPEIACVGVSETEAKRKRMDVRVARLPLAAVGRAVATGSPHGLCKIVYSPEGRIMGVHMAGKGVSELLAEAGLAIEMGAYLDDVAETVHAHPTLSECIHECAELALGKPWHYYLPKK